MNGVDKVASITEHANFGLETLVFAAPKLIAVVEHENIHGFLSGTFRAE
jgi:hypothetical protein